MCARRVPGHGDSVGADIIRPPPRFYPPSRGPVPGRPAGNVRNGGWGTFPPLARFPGFHRVAPCAPAGCRATVIRRGGYHPPVPPVSRPSVGAGPRPAHRKCPETMVWGCSARGLATFLGRKAAASAQSPFTRNGLTAISRPLPCASFPTVTRCAGLTIGCQGRACGPGPRGALLIPWNMRPARKPHERCLNVITAVLLNDLFRCFCKIICA